MSTNAAAEATPKWVMPSDDELMQRALTHRSGLDEIDPARLNEALKAMGDEPVTSGRTHLQPR